MEMDGTLRRLCLVRAMSTIRDFLRPVKKVEVVELFDLDQSLGDLHNGSATPSNS
jgi:hypothetical protein